MAEIITKSGHRIFLDENDVAWAEQFTWHVTRSRARRENYYAFRTKYQGNYKQKSFWLHRELLNAPAGVFVDHKNGNGLDNRRQNLRLCTRAQNMANVSTARPLLRGAYPAGKKWKALISINNKRVYLGIFDDAESAARAYDAACIADRGEFARPNYSDQRSKA